LERARSQLERDFEKFGAEAELRQNDKIVVEWCRAPDAVYRRLQGDSDQDYELLSSFWNTKGYEFSTPIKGARQPLNVRYSVHNFPPLSSSSPSSTSYPNSTHSNLTYSSPRKMSANPMIAPAVSVDASTTQADLSISYDDSLMLSVSTWDDDYRETSGVASRQSTEDDGAARGSFPKRPRPSSSLPTTNSSGPTLPSAVDAPVTKVSVHRYQLQQVLRCSGCYQIFSRNPELAAVPVMSQACGHTLCRGCVVRKADDDYALTQIYQKTIPCPLCHVPHAFSPELHINQSLCAVLALLDS